MKQTNPKIDTYIAKAADFAKPILFHLRELIHDACPEVDEEIKWALPHFSYKGATLCTLGAYKAHISFSLFNADQLKDPRMKESVKAGKKFGYMDKIRTLSELPSEKILTGYLKEIIAINASGVKKPTPSKKEQVPVEVPAFFFERLNKHPKAKKVFESKSPSFRKEYAKWLNDAKTDATRETRATQSIEWISEGKGRFWQYEK